jgi:hypothetical protein
MGSFSKVPQSRRVSRIHAAVLCMGESLNRIESHAKKNATMKMPQQLESGEVRDEKRGCSPFPLDLNNSPLSIRSAVSSVVEHYLDTVGVTGSNPVSRSPLADLNSPS